MYHYLIAVLAVPLLMLGWIAVQSLARRFTDRHPEFGPFREEGEACGAGCTDCGQRCPHDPRDRQRTTPGTPPGGEPIKALIIAVSPDSPPDEPRE